jgi:hypothetical protein
MKWKNVLLDELPGHEQEVLISVKGIYYLTKFNAEEKRFYLIEDPESFFELAGNIIYWTESGN